MNINKFMKENSIAIWVEVDLKEKIFFIRKNNIPLTSYVLFEQLILFKNVDDLLKCISGELMPRIWMQGNTKCMLSKSNDEKMVAIFYDNCMDAKENYFFVQKLNLQIKDLI